MAWCRTIMALFFVQLLTGGALVGIQTLPVNHLENVGRGSQHLRFKLTCTYLELDKHSTAQVHISKTKPFHIFKTYRSASVYYRQIN